MCPVCITTVAPIITGTTSTGGLTAFAVKQLRARAHAGELKASTQFKGGQDDNTNAEQAGSSESRVAS